MYFNGCSSLCLNGKIVGRTAQYGVDEVEVAAANIDLEDVRSYRNAVRSRNTKAASSLSYPRVDVTGFALSKSGDVSLPLSPLIEWIYHSPEEEILLGPACWLWDYLRRSGQGGFLLPLSGGLDSSSTATLVYSMCNLVRQKKVQHHWEYFQRDILGSAICTKWECQNIVGYPTSGG